MVLSVEDVVGDMETTETVENRDGTRETRKIMQMDAVLAKMVSMMIAREKLGRNYGVLVIAEGLAEFLPESYLQGIPRDEFGHLAVANADVGKIVAKHLAAAYKKATGKTRKINGLQMGYESRCCVPTAFDVMLGSQIGIGAYRALIEEKLNGVMISVGGQFDMSFVPFEQLVDPVTLVTRVRFIDRKSDFHRMARLLEQKID